MEVYTWIFWFKLIRANGKLLNIYKILDYLLGQIKSKFWIAKFSESIVLKVT